MKSILLFRNTACAILLLLSVSTRAQIAKTGSARGFANDALAIAATPDKANPDEVTLDGLKLKNEKMYTHFTTNFKIATGVSVYPHEKTTVLYCMVDGIRNNILYTNKGKLVHVVRYYGPELLPVHVSRLIQQGFPDYKMTNASEVNVDGTTAYLVNIESLTKHKIVRVINGEWDIYQDLEKSEE